MKFVITGGSGNISKPVAHQLLSGGHTVRVISRNEKNLEELVQAGAEAAIGSLQDGAFLREAFEGADAVYTMCPFDLDAKDLKAYHLHLARNYSEAIIANNVQYVVNLSSIGAHLEEGAGPVSAMYQVEQVLNRLDNVHVRHLRPAYFINNLFVYARMIQQAGIIGDNFKISDRRLPVAAIPDIAAVVVNELSRLEFTGKSYRYISSDEIGTAEITSIMGEALGRTDLEWLTFTDEQAYQGLLQAGLSDEIASNYVQLGRSMNNGRIMEDYNLQGTRPIGRFKLRDFIPILKSTFNEN